jgi:hypothetical protein
VEQEGGGVETTAPCGAKWSKVERASRSMRLTVTTSPGPMAFNSFNSSRRSGRAPVTSSR